MVISHSTVRYEWETKLLVVRSHRLHHQKDSTHHGRCSGMRNLWANGDSYVLRPASRYSRDGRPMSHRYICPQRLLYANGSATAKLHLATIPTGSLGGSRQRTGALFALAQSTTAWCHDESTSSPSNADTITSTGLRGRPAYNQKQQSCCQHQLLYAVDIKTSTKIYP